MDRTSPMWRFLLRISPEMANMTDEEVRALGQKSCGPGPFLSHEEVMAKWHQQFSEAPAEWQDVFADVDRRDPKMSPDAS